MHSKPELIQTLQSQGLELQTLLSSVDTAHFFDGSSENWSVAHHALHLANAARRVALGLNTPAALSPREPLPSRDFDALKAAYLETLANTPSETLRTMGGRTTLEDFTEPEAYKVQVISSWNGAVHGLIAALDAFPEENLEATALPHPLLGPISTREMLFFTVYHNTHHQRGILNLLERP